MAYTEIFIPDGDYCSDRNHLGCMFERHEYEKYINGFHYCSLYDETIGTVNEFKIDSFKNNSGILLVEEKLKLEIYSIINESFYGN